MKLTITQADIDAGVACNSSHCPIALAAKRKFQVPLVIVNLNQLAIFPYGKPTVFYTMPRVGREFIWAFDRSDRPFDAPAKPLPTTITFRRLPSP